MKKKKSRLRQFICAYMMAQVFFALPIFAFEGWNVYNGEYVYLDKEGKQITNVWKESGGQMCYVGYDGFMARNKLIDYGDNYYYVDANGYRKTNAFVTIDETNAPDNPERWGLHYFDDKGKSIRKTGDTFKKMIEGHWYAYDEEGVIITGWIDSDGSIIDDPTSVLDSGIYYADPDKGYLLQNSWYNFTYDLGVHHIENDGSNGMGTDYLYLDTLWMYFDNSGKKVMSTSEDGTTKVKTINNVRYAFDENGIMIEGFTKNNGTIDTHQQSNPTLTQEIKVYDEVQGSLIKSGWYHGAPARSMDEEDYNDDKRSWFYTLSNGNIIKNKVKSIDGKKYVFDGIGRLKKGFVLTDGNGYYVANYEKDEISRDDFIYGIDSGSKLYGSENSDLKYFSEDDGTLQDGEVRIDINDGTYTFLFNKVGTAYGARNTLKKKSDCYYINGLKLCPWDDTKYGIIKVSDTEYRVVNANGKVIKSKRKVIKDDYENYIVILNDKFVGYVLNEDTKIKLRWNKDSDVGEVGYYYYNRNTIEEKGKTKTIGWDGIAVPFGRTYPTATDLSALPEDMRVNFKVER